MNVPFGSTLTSRQRPPRSLRAAAASVLALVAAMLAFPMVPAQADEKTFVADKSAWFWASNTRMTVCTRPRVGRDGVCQRAAGTDAANPISTGHMAVSMKDGSSDMRAFVHFDSSLVPFGSQITKYIVVLSVSRADESHPEEHSSDTERPPGTISPTAAAIQACAITEFFADGTEGDPPFSTKVTPGAPETPETSDDETLVETTRNEPTYDCGLSADGTPSADGKLWRFDITNIAKKWASLERFDEGIALIPVDKSVKPTWVIEFHGAPRTKAVNDDSVEVVSKKEAAQAIVEYAPGAAVVPPPVTPPIDTGTGGGVTLPPPVDTGGGVTPPADTGSTTAPPPVTNNVPVAAVAGATPGGFYAIVLLAIVGVGLMSTLIGGDPLTAVAGAASASRVAAVLRGRRIAGGEALEAAQVIEEEEIASQE